MSSWKDTVMSDDAVRSELGKYCYPSPKYWDEIDLIRKAQAEISFKLGYEERDKWLKPDELDRLEASYKAGVKEVVEWIEQQDDVMTVINMHCEEKYEAQKKVWFNEKV